VSRTAVPITKSFARHVGNVLGVDWRRVDIDEFRRGLEVEQEHSATVRGDIEKIANIALDHLDELPDYYTRLDRMERGEC